MENYWNREKQVILTLRRDLLVDFYDKYKNEPFFCEKGLVPHTDNFIYNQENMNFNQILQSSTMLKENSSTCRWVVCYFAEGLIAKTGEQPTLEIYINDTKIVIDQKQAYSEEAPYCIACFPYDNYNINFASVSDPTNWRSVFYTHNKSTALMESLSRNFKGSGVLYDMQILPYCPLDRSKITIGLNGAYCGTQANPNLMRILGTNTNDDVDTTEDYVIFSVDQPDLDFTISYSYPYSLTNAEEYKIDNECRFIRLVSPNGSDVFQMNVAKNGGLSSFTVQMTCKPISPFIQIKPNWGRLYGNLNHYSDKRGLIMTGNFTAPMTTNAWLDYQINNSSYKDSFNRQIANMERMNQLDNNYLGLQSGIETVSNGIQGAGAGFLIGGLKGAIIGGAVSAVASALGGNADMEYQKAQQRETLDYTKDMFGFQMQNIKALPNGLSNIGSLDYATATQPIIELYSASNTEIEALKKKLTWNGFTIGRIGTVAEFKANADSVYTVIDTKYVKGQLVQARGIEEDFHLVNEISLELTKGVYFI